MSDPTGENSDSKSDNDKTQPNESQKAIHRNLNSFLNPSFPIQKSPPPDPNGALRLRMAQMELANKMRLNKAAADKEAPKAVPMRSTPPPGGFGSASGVFHMQRGNFGQKTNPTPPVKRSPYQQILAGASKPPEPAKEETPKDAKQAVLGSEGQEVIEIPEGAEVTKDEKPKRLPRKRFQNPKL